MTLKQLQVEAHQIAVAAGWWEPAPSDDAVWCNFLAEVSEAWEEYRAGWPLADIRTVNGKPEGFFVEIADLVIRIADYAEARWWELGCRVVPPQTNPATFCLWLSELLIGSREDGNPYTFNTVVGGCLAFAEQHGVNLQDVVRLKMDYNRTRPYRHGGKIA